MVEILPCKPKALVFDSLKGREDSEYGTIHSTSEIKAALEVGFLKKPLKVYNVSVFLTDLRSVALLFSLK